MVFCEDYTILSGPHAAARIEGGDRAPSCLPAESTTHYSPPRATHQKGRRDAGTHLFEIFLRLKLRVNVS